MILGVWSLETKRGGVREKETGAGSEASRGAVVSAFVLIGTDTVLGLLVAWVRKFVVTVFRIEVDIVGVLRLPVTTRHRLSPWVLIYAHFACIQLFWYLMCRLNEKLASTMRLLTIFATNSFEPFNTHLEIFQAVQL